MKILSRYSRIKKSLFYLSFILALSCAGGNDDGYFMSFFQPEISVKGLGFHDYHFSPSFFYGSGEGYENFYSDSDLYAKDDNLQEWITYIGGNFTEQEAGQAIYRRNRLTYWNDGKPAPVSEVFLEAIKKHPAAMKYLEFAWKVEEAQTKSAEWDSAPSGKDSLALEKLLPEAMKAARSEKDLFLKERYAFQAIKIDGELDYLDEEIKLYGEFFGRKAGHSPMQYWAECRIGGAYLIEQDTSHAIYHLAQVFQNCPSKRYAAYMSLRLNDVMFDPKALRYCKSGKEKAAVYAICATQPWQESTNILNGMLAADPSDSLIRLVFTRELNKVEYNKYFSRSYTELDDADSEIVAKRKAGISGVKKLMDIASAAAVTESVPNHAFWYAAEAHAAFLSGDFVFSKELLDKAEKIGTTDTVLRDQLILQKFLLFSELTKQMTPEKEDELIPMLELFSDKRNMQHSNAFSYAATRIEKLYNLQLAPVIRGGFPGCSSSTSSENSAGLQFAEAKSFIFHLLSKAPNDDFGGYWYFNSPDRKNDLDLINDLSPSHTVQATIEYFEMRNPRNFDKRLQKISRITANPLYRLMGTRALAEQKYPEAEKAFSHIDTALWNTEPYTTYLAANPFWTGMLDSHAAVAADTIRYTPLTYSQKMKELGEKVNHGGTAEDCFELACGLYNLTAWGNSWLMMRDSWSGADELGTDFWLVSNTNSDSAYRQTIAHAENYFDEAGRRSKDKEYAARSYFMAAKCEQKLFLMYMSERYSARTEPMNKNYIEESEQFDSLLYIDQKKSYRRYFNRLLTDYADTKFSKEARTECAYFDRYGKGM